MGRGRGCQLGSGDDLRRNDYYRWFDSRHISLYVAETGRTVNRSAVARYEWNGRTLATHGTGYIRLRSIGQAELRLAFGSTLGTTRRNISEFLLTKEHLFTDCPNKRIMTIAAG